MSRSLTGSAPRFDWPRRWLAWDCQPARSRLTRHPTPSASSPGRCRRPSACATSRQPRSWGQEPMPRAGERSVRGRSAGPHGGGERLTAGFDLASRWLGTTVVAASDESFGDKENLLDPKPAAFEPGRYGNRGEIVDGWETRRRREPGNDWALIRLGAPGIVTSVDVDTSFFTGNFPTACVVEACGAEGYPSPAELLDPATEWAEL